MPLADELLSLARHEGAAALTEATVELQIGARKTNNAELSAALYAMVDEALAIPSHIHPGNRRNPELERLYCIITSLKKHNADCNWKRDNISLTTAQLLNSHLNNMGRVDQIKNILGIREVQHIQSNVVAESKNGASPVRAEQKHGAALELVAPAASPLYKAVNESDLAKVVELTNANCDLEQRYSGIIRDNLNSDPNAAHFNNHETILHFAVRRAGELSEIKDLSSLEETEQRRLRNELAQKHENALKIIRLLTIKKPALMQTPDAFGNMPIFWAVFYSDKDIVAVLPKGDDKKIAKAQTTKGFIDPVWCCGKIAEGSTLIHIARYALVLRLSSYWLHSRAAYNFSDPQTRDLLLTQSLASIDYSKVKLPKGLARAHQEKHQHEMTAISNLTETAITKATEIVDYLCAQGCNPDVCNSDRVPGIIISDDPEKQSDIWAFANLAQLQRMVQDEIAEPLNNDLPPHLVQDLVRANLSLRSAVAKFHNPDCAFVPFSAALAASRPPVAVGGDGGAAAAAPQQQRPPAGMQPR